MRPLIISERAISTLGALDANIEEILVDEGDQARHQANVHFGAAGVYVITEACDASSRLLVIRRWQGGLFDGVPPADRRSVFDRCVRIALRSFDKSVALNPKWMPYRQDNRVSLFAFGPGSLERLVAEVSFLQSGDAYVFDMAAAADVKNLAALTPDPIPYQEARREFDAIVRSVKPAKAADDGNIDLELLDPGSIVKGFSYDDWYQHLSPKQREFVERDLVGPLRLRGAAGTGKTLAMVMKAVRIKKEADLQSEPKRILFLTHSWSMAEQIDGLVHQLDHGTRGSATLDVYPLLEIARQRDYSDIGRQPLGVDSEDGKRKALAEIGEVLAAFKAGDWITFRGGCSQSFVEAVEAQPGTRALFHFQWDLLVEFGCVLAAQGILGRSGEIEKYLRIRRMQYMMPLKNTIEKTVVFNLWSKFLNQLKIKNMISSDQVICDILADLQTFYWEAARSQKGYDVIFVDETHLFNAQERLTFHHLLSNGDIPPLVVMALDPKQSPREMFTAMSQEGDTAPADIYDRARLPKSEHIDLVDVYRYTPEIDALIKSVLNAAPGLDLSDDWNVAAATSGLASGPTPIFRVLPTKLALYKEAISLAKKSMYDARKRGGRVAILCMDPDRFSEYKRAVEVQEPKDVFVVSSRDDAVRLPFMAKRIVFSTPEYVAGLQFDTVILVDVNRDLVPEGGYRGHQQRRFLSELYLGMSRAEHHLTILASRDGDGLSPALNSAVEQGFIIEA
jgi:hypothetical protein